MHEEPGEPSPQQAAPAHASDATTRPVRHSVEHALAASLHLFFLVAACVYAVIAVVNALSTDPAAETVRGLDAAAALILFALAAWLRLRPATPLHAPRWVALLACVTITTGSAGLLRNPASPTTLTLELTVLVAGVLLTRSRLYALVTALVFAALGLVIAQSGDPGSWTSAFARVVGFTGAGWMLHVVQRRQLARIATLRAENLERSRALDASDLRFRTLAENTRDLVTVIDSQLRFVYVSQRSREMLGYEPEELIGRTPDAVVLPEDQTVASERAPSWWEGSGDVITFRCHRKDGSRVLHDVNARPIDGPEGRCLVLTSRDATDRIALEERLRDAQKHQSLSVMAGGIAHDFNNLMTVVLGEAELARGLDADEAKPSLDRVVEAVDRAQRLTAQLIAYAGGMPRDDRELDLAAEVEGVVDLVRSSIPQNADLRFDFDPEPPAVRADPGQLQQLILNLVLNAAESRRGGRVRVTISVRDEWLDARAASELAPAMARPAGRHAVLAVEDDGGGIAPDVVGRVFDPFFTTKHAGRGLGLAAVLGVARAHRAGVRVESQPGKGSRFTVYLPRLESPVPAEAPRPPAAIRDLGPGRALVVDDQPNVRRVVAQSCAGLGLEPALASSGEEALALARNADDAFRIALVDLSMPGLDGIETQRRLREIAPDLPVLLMSGYDQPGALAESAPRDVGFLRKPFTQAQLAERVRELLGARS